MVFQQGVIRNLEKNVYIYSAVQEYNRKVPNLLVAIT